MVKINNLDFETYVIPLETEDTFWEFLVGQEPDYIQGVEFMLSPPAGGQIIAQASVSWYLDSDKKYGEIGLVANRSNERSVTVDTIFRHFKIRSSIAGGICRVMCNGRLRQVGNP